MYITEIVTGDQVRVGDVLDLIAAEGGMFWQGPMTVSASDGPFGGVKFKTNVCPHILPTDKCTRRVFTTKPRTEFLKVSGRDVRVGDIIYDWYNNWSDGTWDRSVKPIGKPCTDIAKSVTDSRWISTLFKVASLNNDDISTYPINNGKHEPGLHNSLNYEYTYLVEREVAVSFANPKLAAAFQEYLKKNLG